MLKKTITKALPAVILSSLLAVAVIWAWTEPGAVPPGGNVPAPINVGGVTQTKTGSLNIATQAGSRVGIGTAPSYKLDVSGDARITTHLGVGGAPSTNYRIYAYSGAPYGIRGDGSTMGGYFYDTDGTSRVYVAFGNYGIYQQLGTLNYFTGDTSIGTTAVNGKLTVNGNIAPSSANTGQVGTGTHYWNQMNAGAYYYRSDINLKKNIKPLNNTLEKILQLRGVSFQWKDTQEESIGLIAQEVEEFFPDFVFTNEETGVKTLDYAKLVVPLIEAVKEQQKEIEELRAIIQ